MMACVGLGSLWHDQAAAQSTVQADGGSTLNSNGSWSTLSGWAYQNTFQQATAASARFPAATATISTAQRSGGVIIGITLTGSGGGYTSPPAVTISGGGGTGATAVTTINANGQVDSISITNGGSDYLSNPTVTIANSGRVQSVNVVVAGIGYATTPRVSFTGGGGSGATAVATVSSTGAVTGIAVTDTGSGYTSNPTVVIDPPAPGGIGSNIHFNTDITADRFITLDAPRTVGQLVIGDLSSSQIYTLNSGSGGSLSNLTFDMGDKGGLNAFLNKFQGGNDIINTPVFFDNNLNARVTAARLTLTGLLSGTGTLTSWGGGTLALTGDNTGGATPLWLWQRGSTGTGAQVELGATTGNAIGGDIMMGNSQQGGSGHTVLQLFGTFSASTTAGSTVLFDVSAPASIAVGMPINGSGIPSGAVVTAVNVDASTVTLSAAATASATGVAMGVSHSLNASTLTGSNILGNAFGVTIGLAAGMPMSGGGIPAGTTIAGVTTGTLAFIGNTVTNSALITNIPAATVSALAVGMGVSGTGIPANSVITAIPTATSITLSAVATATGNDVALVRTPFITLSANATATTSMEAISTGRTNVNQISDTATLWFDGATGPDRNNYFKLMGGNETVGRLVDMGGRAVIENRESEGQVLSGAILTIAGNADSRVTGFIRDNSGSNLQQADGFVLGGDIASGSSVINNVVAPSTLTVGMIVTGSGIPAGTRITAVSGNTVTLSASATQTGTGRSLHAAAANSLGITKNGLGNLTLAGGNIIYSGPTTINEGTLTLSNTTNFRSHIVNNAALVLDVTGSTTWTMPKSFADPDGSDSLAAPPIERLTVTGTGSVTKTGSGTFNFSSTNTEIGMLSVKNGTLGLSSLTNVTGGIVAGGDMSLNRNLRFIGSSTTIQGGINATGKFGQATGTLSALTFSGGLGVDSAGNPIFINTATRVGGPISVRHMDLILESAVVSLNKNANDVATTNSTSVVLTDVSNLIIGMKVTGSGVPSNTTLQSVDTVNKIITLSNPATIPQSAQLNFRMTSHADGRIIGIGAGAPDSVSVIGVPGAANATGATVGPGRIKLNNTFEANNADRLPNITPIISKGGLFEFRNDGTNNVFAETVGALNLVSGQLQVSAFRSGDQGSSTLTFGSLSHSRGATVEFVGRDFSSGTEVAANDSLGALDNTRNRILFGPSPTLTQDLIGGWAIAGTQFASYGTNGVMPLPVEKRATGNQTTWLPKDNVNAVVGANETLTARRMINSLNLNNNGGTRTLNLVGFPLAIQSGGILSGTTNNASTISGTGSLTVPVATGSSRELFMHVIANTLTVSAPIRDTNFDQAMTGTTGSTNASVNSAAGLVPGMTVSGTSIPAGTTIVSVNYQTNEIVLSAPPTASFTSQLRTFSGGSVDLVKSGVGTLVLSGDNEFTGKAILNNGIVRITQDGQLGSVPSAFESNKVILNGGTLLVNNSIDLAANRGITINEAGGRIEVGTLATDQFTVNMTAPMTVNGVLELAVRGNPATNTTSVLNLGTAGGGNNFPMGIKTEGNFEGRINLLGNNTLGGLFMEAGNVFMTGNNNFTGDIRIAGGKWTVSGNNTFNGAASFPEPIIVSSALLNLQSATAFGTAPFAVDLSGTAEMRLNGISQTLRSIAGVAGTSITNSSANATPATITFDLETNQTFSGTLEDGIGTLSVTKKGPGRLLLNTLNGSSFTGVLRIEGGSIEVDTATSGAAASQLGAASLDAANIVLAGGTLAFSPAREQTTNRSFTLGAGATGGTLVANGTSQSARVIMGVAFQTPSVAFEGSGPRTLTLSGFNLGDNEFNIELGDKSAAEPTTLLKTGAGTWVLGKAEPFTGLTVVQDGVLAVRNNNALGTASVATTVSSGANTFTGNVPNGVQVNFPNLNGSTLPSGIAADIPYYVVQSTGTTFKISTTPGGTPVAVGSSGSGVTYTSNINPIASTTASFSLDGNNSPLPGWFTGNLPTGTALTFATRQVQVAAPTSTNPYAVNNTNGVLPTNISSTTTYYVVNADGNQFQVATSPGGSPVTFTTNGNDFFYSAVPVSNKSGGVNLVGGRLDLRDVNYATPETLFFEGGSLFVPVGSKTSWAGNMQVNVNSNITLGQNSELTLQGNLLGNRTFNQLGEGTLILRGEAIAPTTVSDNNRRTFVVQAGTLVLDYSSNNNSKLVDTATLQVGGGRRGGMIRLSGGSHEEIVNALSLQAGANTIYRDSGNAVIRLNAISRATGASLYFDQPNIAEADNYNLNGVLGAWAIIRNTATNEYDWAKNGTTVPGDYNDGLVVPNNDPSPDPFTRNANTSVVSNFARPSGLSAWTLRFMQEVARTVTFNASNPNAAPTIIQTGGILISPTVGANDSLITGAGKLTTQNQGNLQNFIVHQHNDQADLIINNPLVDRAVFSRDGMLTFNDPISVRRGIVVPTTTGLEVGMTVVVKPATPGTTDIPGNSSIVSIDVGNNTVVINNDHAVNGQTRTLLFTSSDGLTTIEMNATLPPSLARRVISGVDVLGASALANDDVVVGMAVTGSGIPANTTVVAILNNNTIVISANHSYNDSRVLLTFAAGAIPAREGSFNSSNVRRIIGLKRPDFNESLQSSTSDLYLGMAVAGTGIPAGASIDFIWPGSTSGSTDSRDIRINADHSFNGIDTTLTFTPVIGIEKLGPGTLVLGGASTYTGVTFIGDGTVRAQTLTDGGVAGSLGASSAAQANLSFNGGTLQYIGEHSSTNRGLTLTDFAAVNVGHERTVASISGSISGADTFEKTGPGTLVMKGSAGLSDLRVNEGRLQVQVVDTNFTASGFGQSNFGNTNLTAVHLAGGVLEVRGTEEGNVSQNYGGQLYVERGGSEVRSTSVSGYNPANLNAGATGRNTTLTLMGGEEITQVFRNSGGTVRFVENPEANSGEADIFVNLPTPDRGTLLPWAVYWNTFDTSAPNVRDFATVELASGAVTSASEAGLEKSSADLMNADIWGVSAPGFSLNLVESSSESFYGTLTGDREANVLRYAFDGDSTINIPAGESLRLISGAILISSEVGGGKKEIVGGGDIRGGAVAVDGRDMIIHNYNMGSTFTMGVNIINEVVDMMNSGSTISGSREIRVGFAGALPLNQLRVGMAISGPGIQEGTVVQSVSVERFRVQLSKPVTVTQTNASFHFADVSSFVHSGIGTTELAGTNTYAGGTFLNGGVLRLNSANAIPGGIGTTGGTSALRIEGGVLGLGLSDFSRGVGTGVDQVEFQGSGGFAAYGADRLVNIGGSAAKLRFGNNSFVPDGSSLLLGAHDATHKVTLLNPLDLGSFSQVVRTDNGPAPVEGELAGALSGLGRLIKLGFGSLRLAVPNTHSGGVEVAEGTLVAANVANVFGTSAGVVRMGTSATNTSPSAALTVKIEGGTVTNELTVGNVNAPGKAWRTEVLPDTGTAGADVGQHTSHLIVNGNPAIAYYDVTNGDLKYVRSNDANGVTWAAPVILDNAGDVGQFASLQMINGVPAVSYYDATNNNLKFVRAADGSGSAWTTPIIVLGGVVNAQAVQADGKLLIGGSFIAAGGGERGNLARMNDDGTVDAAFAPKTNDQIRAIALQADGRILIGGAFTTVDGTARNRLARLNADGSLDNTLPDLNINGDVRTIAVQPDGRILIGGAFTSVNGATRNRIARLEANGAFEPSNAQVETATVQGTITTAGNARVIVTASGMTNSPKTIQVAVATNDTAAQVAAKIRAALAADTNVTSRFAVSGTNADVVLTRLIATFNDATLNLDIANNTSAGLVAAPTSADTVGAIPPFDPNANGEVRAIVLQSNGKILIGGAFTTVSGISRTRLARVNTDKSLDTSFVVTINNDVNAVALQTDGRILLGGTFTSISGVTRNRIARVETDASLDTSFNPNANNEVRAIAVQGDGAIVIGGTFTVVGGESRNRLARLLATGAVDTAFNPDVNGPVQTVLVKGDGRIALGGSFANVGNVGRHWSAQLNPNGSLDMAFLPRLGAGGQYNSLQTINGNPAISYYDNVTGDLKYVRSSNTNGTAWDPAVTVAAVGDVGQYTSLQIVGISSAAVFGYPAISYYDVTNGNLKYVRAVKADGKPDVNGEAWGQPLTIASTGDVGKYTTLLMVADEFTILRPAISYYDVTNGDLKYTRATDVDGVAAWGAPVTIDSTGDVGSYASLQIVNNNPIVDGGVPAISYYDATGGDLKYVRALNQAGSSWGTPTVVLGTGDVGRFSSLQMVNGGAAMSFYDATSGDLRFARISDAAGFNRLVFDAATNWQGKVTLDGSLMLAPVAGQTAALNGIIAGAAGLRLITAGTIDLTNGANTFGAELTPGAAINGGAIVRAGTLRVTNSTALGSTTVELGDARPQVLTVDRATVPGTSLTSLSGTFRPNHNGRTPNGAGAFVGIGAMIDGVDYSAGSTTATVQTVQGNAAIRALSFSGNLANGTAVRFYGANLPVIIDGDTTYYVVESTGTTFRVAATPGGSALIFARPPLTTLPNDGTTYALTYFLHFGKFILVKDEAANPERNGVYEIFYNGVLQPAGTINLGRVAAMDSVAELAYGTSVNVANGSSMGKAFFIGSVVSNINVSAVHWIEDIADPQLALLAAADGVTISNPIDVNAVNPTGTTSLGGVSTLTSGNVTFNGNIVLQDLKPNVQETQTLSLTSSTSTGLGVVVAGLISEADGGNGATNDHLVLAKTGAGIVSITGANTHTGGLSVNQGTLLVMNTTGSATGTGPVAVNAGGVLGGTGFIGGNVTLQGVALNNAVLRPGDPTSVAGPVEALTINGTLTVGPDSVVQYTLGTDNYNKLIATSVSVMPTGRLMVDLAANYVPPTGTVFDILDGALTFTAGGQADLRDYLKLPGQYLWDASQFQSQGTIKVTGEAVPVAITTQPVGNTVNPGTNVTFSVTVSGSADFRYQWQKNVGGTYVDVGPAATWSSATTSTLTLNGVVEADEGTYRVIVQNGWDGFFTEISTPVALVVNDPPTIVIHPQPQSVNPGGDVTFTVAADGVAPISYQWQKFDGTNWVNLTGKTTDTLSLTSVVEADEGSYRARVSNNAGPVFSNPATLTVNNPVAFTTHPASQTKSVGDTVTFTAVATGTAPVTYQWQHRDTSFGNWTDLPGATASSFTIDVIEGTDGGDYRVVATNLVNSLPSNPATLTAIVGLPFFSLHPVSQMIQLGTELRLRVNASGADPITYQWYKNGAKIAGATNPEYLVPADKLALTHAGIYKCHAKNIQGEVPSRTAEIGVVNNILKTLVIASDATATMNCLAAGNGLQYKWKKGNIYLANDLRIGGATTKTLTIKKTVVGDIGDYFCEVTGLAGGPVTGGSHHLTIVNDKPVIPGAQPIQMPKAFIGANYEYTIQTDSVENHLAVSFAATGLPTGLKIDTKTGKISGRPTVTKGAVPYAVTLSATNMKGTAKAAALLVVEPVPAGALGVFAGPIERHVILNDNLGGRFDLTVAAAGTFSGKVTLGATSYSFASGLLMIDPTGVEMPKGEVNIKRTGTPLPPALKVTFTIDSASNRLVANIGAGTDNVAAQAWRNIWSTTAISLKNCGTVNGNPDVTCPSTAQLRVGMYVTGAGMPPNAHIVAIVDATKFTISANATVSSDPFALPTLTAKAEARLYQGLYNVGLDIGGADVDSPLVPQGTGYMTFTVAAAGTLTIAGKTADGESLTGGAFVGPLGEILIFQNLYTTKPKGSILGSLDIDPLVIDNFTDNTVAGAATQLRRQPNPLLLTHRTYRAGFFIDLAARGGIYRTPKSMGTLLLGIPKAQEKQVNSGLSFAGITTTTALPPNINVIAGETAVTVPLDGGNVGKKTKLTVNGTTGVFNGTLSLTDNNPNPPPTTVTRSGTFNGVILPENGGWVGYGFYLLPDLPDAQAGTTDKTAPIKSGQVLFEQL